MSNQAHSHFNGDTQPRRVQHRRLTRVFRPVSMLLSVLTLALTTNSAPVQARIAAAPLEQAESEMQIIYRCPDGLCRVVTGSSEVQTVVAFSAQSQDLYGYALSLDGTLLVYALGDASGTSDTAVIYLADPTGMNRRMLFSIKAIETIGVGFEGFGVIGLTADNDHIIFEEMAQVFTAKLDGSERRPVLGA